MSGAACWGHGSFSHAGLNTRMLRLLREVCLVLSFFLEMQSESGKNDTLNPFFLPIRLRSFPSPRVTKICAADKCSGGLFATRRQGSFLDLL